MFFDRKGIFIGWLNYGRSTAQTTNLSTRLATRYSSHLQFGISSPSWVQRPFTWALTGAVHLSIGENTADNNQRRREGKWNAMTKEEREHYANTTTDKGNKRLDFRFAH